MNDECGTHPFLSIVIPTREGFGDSWLRALLKVKGSIEFILIHPPGMTPSAVDDPRLKQIVSPLRGELIQRSAGLMSATGIYLLSINCDEYLHPDIETLVRDYFDRFPDSWVLRLARREFPYGDRVHLESEWVALPEVKTLDICSKQAKNAQLFQENSYLLEIPIAPLENPIDFSALSGFRQDHKGTHTENFDKKVWKRELVRQTLPELTALMNVSGPIKYIPFWCLDRLLGLYLQAKFFEKDKTIGHWMPKVPEQIRVEDNPPEHTRANRYYFLAEIFLIRRFPQYGYFWNLIFSQGRDCVHNVRDRILKR